VLWGTASVGQPGPVRWMCSMLWALTSPISLPFHGFLVNPATFTRSRRYASGANNQKEETMAQSNTARTANEESEGQPSSARRPVHTSRVGNVEIAVWKNDGTAGEFYTASAPVIRYKDGEQWKDGKSMAPSTRSRCPKPPARRAPEFASCPRGGARRGKKAKGKLVRAAGYQAALYFRT